MTHQRPGLLFALIGPPGAGKNALMNDALARASNGNLRQLATATTRPMRPTEVQGREHRFMDIDSFQAMIERGDLLEWQQVHGNLYGIPRQALEEAFASGQDLTADIDVLGATYIRSLYPNNVVLIFIAPPASADLEKRMRTRGETESAIATRMKRVPMEMTYAPLCDYVIVNDDLQKAAERLNEIIQIERQRLTENPGENRQFAYRVSVVALYQDEVLYHEGDFLTDSPRNGEMPYQTALRLIRDTFGVENPQTDALFEAMPHEGSFIPPLMVEASQTGSGRELHFLYVYLMPERIAPPDGWYWTPLDAANLPQPALDALHAQKQTATGD